LVVSCKAACTKEKKQRIYFVFKTNVKNKYMRMCNINDREKKEGRNKGEKLTDRMPHLSFQPGLQNRILKRWDHHQQSILKKI